MAHMLKNTRFKTASYALGLPVGTSSVGPNSPVIGQARWNTTTSRFEYYTGSAWQATAHEGNVTIVADKSFVGTGSRVLFEPMSYSYSAGQEAQVIVFVGTVYQIPGTNYTFAGNSSIQFGSAPSNLSSITILHNFASTVAA
jgi:hypothetical protein